MLVFSSPPCPQFCVSGGVTLVCIPQSRLHVLVTQPLADRIQADFLIDQFQRVGVTQLMERAGTVGLLAVPARPAFLAGLIAERLLIAILLRTKEQAVDTR